MTPQEYHMLEARFVSALRGYDSVLEPEAMDGVKHYVDHGELEMAFELFCLHIIKVNKRFSKQYCNELMSIGTALGLNRESVFEINFWTIFSQFIQDCIDSTATDNNT